MLLFSPDFIDYSELHHRDQEVKNVENYEYLLWRVYILVKVVHHLYDQNTLVDGLRVFKVMRPIVLMKFDSLLCVVKGRERCLELGVSNQRIFEHEL